MTCETKEQRESGSAFLPLFDSNDLIVAVVSDHVTSELLMVAYMNPEALSLTQSTGIAHFYSRSRQQLWKKGESSGNILEVMEIRTDCDQDAIWIKAKPAGPTCHTGARSCFYRKIEDGKLEFVS